MGKSCYILSTKQNEGFGIAGFPPIQSSAPATLFPAFLSKSTTIYSLNSCKYGEWAWVYEWVCTYVFREVGVPTIRESDTVKG